jgi:hypothetical protein
MECQEGHAFTIPLPLRNIALAWGWFYFFSIPMISKASSMGYLIDDEVGRRVDKHGIGGSCKL